MFVINLHMTTNHVRMGMLVHRLETMSLIRSKYHIL